MKKKTVLLTIGAGVVAVGAMVISKMIACEKEDTKDCEDWFDDVIERHSEKDEQKHSCSCGCDKSCGDEKSETMEKETAEQLSDVTEDTVVKSEETVEPNEERPMAAVSQMAPPVKPSATEKPMSKVLVDLEHAADKADMEPVIIPELTE